MRGRVLAIGGVKDKALAAHRHGIRRLILPAENRRDLLKVPDNVRADMEFIFVSDMDEVISAAIILDDQQAEVLSEDVELVSKGYPSRARRRRKSWPPRATSDDQTIPDCHLPGDWDENRAPSHRPVVDRSSDRLKLCIPHRLGSLAESQMLAPLR